ncbi:MAG TPA: hypothetical protein VGF07_11925 [Stellaceae bacterium]|jgi:hypothetical protein
MTVAPAAYSIGQPTDQEERERVLLRYLTETSRRISSIHSAAQASASSWRPISRDAPLGLDRHATGSTAATASPEPASTLSTDTAANRTAALPVAPGAGAAVFSDGLLTTWVQDGNLYIRFDRHVVTGPILGVFLFDVFIDADRDRSTGDYRGGHLAGVEYHIVGSFASWSGGSFDLYQVPTTPAEAAEYFLSVGS